MKFQKPRYRYLYLAGFLLSLHYALTAHINSTYLGTIMSQANIDNLYIISSIITILCLIGSVRFLKRYSNSKTMLFGITVEVIALLTLAFSKDVNVIKIAFIIHDALPPLLLFGLDIFFEDLSRTNAETERKRSFYLTATNTAYLAAPFVAGMIIARGSYSLVYILSAVFVFTLWLLVADVFIGVNPKIYSEVGFFDSINKFFKRKRLGGILLVNFFLQCFYAFMIIFTGPYLHNTIGLGWGAIGLIFTIMLVPFIIFDPPLGKLFNKFHDEKEILIVGFLIMAISTISMGLVHTQSFLVFAFILFMTRVGASFVEAASEAAFFKNITDHNAGFIGIFRQAVPLSFVIAPIVAGLLLKTAPITTLYVAFGLALFLGAAISYGLDI